ncbi:MAG TPA: hypothetical protein VFC25_15740 [Verrucomicrobiae bacterium]|nr:hypothetical protein [Verrucomicrobiae bacterium]
MPPSRRCSPTSRVTRTADSVSAGAAGVVCVRTDNAPMPHGPWRPMTFAPASIGTMSPPTSPARRLKKGTKSVPRFGPKTNWFAPSTKK